MLMLGLRSDRIEVIYPGVAESFFEATPIVRPKPYLLYVGTIEPRKNVAALLDAYQQLPLSLTEEFDLVIAGPAGWNSPDLLRRLSQSWTPPLGSSTLDTCRKPTCQA